MITFYSLKGEDLKKALSADPEFFNRNLPEKAIHDYSDMRGQMASDLPRINKIRLINEEGQSQEYIYGKRENVSADLPKEIVEFITKDTLMQTYLYSELHQSGILFLSTAAWVSPPLMSIQRHAAPLKGDELEEISPLLLKGNALNAYVEVRTHADYIEICTQSVFSDAKTYGVDYPPDHEGGPHPLFLSTFRFKIELQDNPEAKPEDPLDKKKKISITSLDVEVDVIPGKEEMFKAFYEGYVNQFNLSKKPIPKIDVNGIDFTSLMFKEYIHKRMEWILFNPDQRTPEQRIQELYDFVTLFRQIGDERFQEILNTKQIGDERVQEILNTKNEKGNTLLHDAYWAKDPNIAMQLLMLGADFNIKNAAGYSFKEYWESRSNISFSIYKKSKRNEITEFLRLHAENPASFSPKRKLSVEEKEEKKEKEEDIPKNKPSSPKI